MIGGALSPSVTAVKLESEKQSPVLSILFTNSLSSSNYLNSVLDFFFCFVFHLQNQKSKTISSVVFPMGYVGGCCCHFPPCFVRSLGRLLLSVRSHL